MNVLLPLLCTLSVMLICAEARFRLEIRVLRYDNPTNRDFRNDCCDSCGNPCDPFFFFCVRGYQNSPSTSDSPCTYGSAGTAGHHFSATSRTFPLGQNIAGSSVPNPIVFSSTRSWPGQFQFMVRVQDDDADAPDLVDRVIVDRRLSPSSSFTSTVTQRGFYRTVTMQFQFRVMCQTNYHGSSCTVFCAPQDSDAAGHYTCNSNGQRVCRSGYTGTGTNCRTAVCASGCDQGTCSRPGICDICNSGWSGSLCNICLPEGCDPNRATCNAPGECNCNEGYSGNICQNDDDICGHRAPCRNGAMCANTGANAYACSCPPHFTGVDCETEIDACDSSPCLNGGICSRTVDSFTCTCGVGWTGQTCEDNIDECATDSPPCQNNGTCTDCTPTLPMVILSPSTPSSSSSSSSSCPVGYLCECPEGFFGDDCEVDIDYCLSTPCQNGATCHDVMGAPGYSCACPAGFAGVDCEEDVDECAIDGVCENGGTCTNTEGSFSCSCPTGTSGARCETNFDDCASSPCHSNNSQRCTDAINTYTCVCLPGFTGTNCEDVFDECEVFPCMNNGTCTPTFNDFSCECPAGITGRRCGVVIDNCHPDLCLSGGTCINQVNDYTCQCSVGRTGVQCEVELHPCDGDPSPCPKEKPVCEKTAEDAGFVCKECQDSDVDCKNSLAQGGNNNTQTEAPGNQKTGSIVGGVVGGVAAAILLLLVLITILWCCCKNQCCCCCCPCRHEDTKEEYVVESTDHSQNNPIYFGVSTLVSSTGDSMPRTSRYLPPKPTPSNNNHYHNNGGYVAMTTTTPTSREDDPHYERIPVANGITSQAVASGSYSHLLDRDPATVVREETTTSEPVLAKAAEDQGAPPKGGSRENLYVAGPLEDAYEMGAEAQARRDMYTVLPSSEQLQKMANE